MKLLNLTLESAESNLALDEAMLVMMDQDPHTEDVLRIWEPKAMHVVLGRASKAKTEVCLESCRADGVPILRRTTGGATILAGPGCLFYSVVLHRQRHPQLSGPEPIHESVLTQVATGLGSCVTGIRRDGISDLTVPGPHGTRLKFSGNSLRLRRQAILYHGTVLCDFPLAAIPKYLGTPPRQPDYRGDRVHADFVTHLARPAAEMATALRTGFPIDGVVTDYPQSMVDQLIEAKYGREDWNLKL